MTSKSVKKHRCVMAAVNEIQLSTELCTLASPALLAMDKMCLHYVIHYIKRSDGILSLEHFILNKQRFLVNLSRPEIIDLTFSGALGIT